MMKKKPPSSYTQNYTNKRKHASNSQPQEAKRARWDKPPPHVQSEPRYDSYDRQSHRGNERYYHPAQTHQSTSAYTQRGNQHPNLKLNLNELEQKLSQVNEGNVHQISIFFSKAKDFGRKRECDSRTQLVLAELIDLSLSKLMTLRFGRKNNLNFYRGILYGMGLCAERGWFKKEVDEEPVTQVIDKLLSQLNPLPSDSEAQEFANIIYGLGKLAEVDLLAKTNKTHLAQAITQFTHALSHKQPNEQNIANTIYGLGKLAEKGLLPESSTVGLTEVVMQLTQALQSKQPNEQNIANTLHGLGKLAEKGLLPEKSTRGLTEVVVYLTQALQKKQPNEQDIANTLHGLGKLAEKGLLPESSTVHLAEVVMQLTQALQKKQPKEQAIANTIHGLGKLAEKGLLPESSTMGLAEVVVQLTQALQKKQPKEQAIANTLHGLGKLAEKGLLPESNTTGLAKAVVQLTQGLQSKQPKEQEIANTLYGLGKLAEKGLLPESNTTGLAKAVVQLTQGLQSKQPNEQNIANTLHGLGKLAEKGLLSESSTMGLAEVVMQLTQALQKKQPNEQEIANTLHGLGKLAEKGLLPESSTVGLTEVVMQLTQGLQKKQPNEQEIANTLHGLGKLAEKGLLPESSTVGLTEVVMQLTQALQKKQPNEQEIANTLHGLGKLAEKGLLPESSTVGLAEVVMQLTQALQKKQPNAQEIANTLHGLGKLAEKGLLPESSTVGLAEVVVQLTQALQKKQPNEQEIANTLHGLGKLAEKGLLAESSTVGLTEVVMQLTQALQKKQPNEQEIANTLHGLGKLAEKGLLPESSTVGLAEVVVQLTQALQKKQPNEQEIANTLHGLGKLAEKGLLSESRITGLTEVVVQLTQALQKKQPNAQEIANTLHSLGKLAEKRLLSASTDLSLATQALLRRLCIKLHHDKNKQRSAHVYALTSTLTGYGQLLRMRDPQSFSVRELRDLAILSHAALSYRLNANKLYFMALTLHPLRPYSTKAKPFAQQFDEVYTRLQPLLAELSAQSQQEMLALQESSPVVTEVESASCLLADDVEPIYPSTLTQSFNLAETNGLARFRTYLNQDGRTYEGQETVAITLKSVAVINSLGAYTNQAVASEQRLGYYEGKSVRVNAAISNSRYSYDREDGYYVDATTLCNWTAFINHSSVPNVVVRYDEVEGQRKIGIYTLRPLQTGEQLLLDYGHNYFQYLDEVIVPKYLHPRDDERHSFDYYQAYSQHYQHVLTFSTEEQQILGLKTAYLRIPDQSHLLAYSMHNATGVTAMDFVESTQQQQLTLLMLASYQGNVDKVQDLLTELDLDVNRQATLSGDTAICFALKGQANDKQKLRMVKAIKAHPLYETKRTGQTDDVLLYLALVHHCATVVNLLLPKPAKKPVPSAHSKPSATTQHTSCSNTNFEDQAASLISRLVEEQRDDIIGQLVITGQFALFERVIANYRLQELYFHVREGLINLRLMLKDLDEAAAKQVVTCLFEQGQCYRDSQVVERLINALSACTLLSPKQVRALQQQVLERAKTFHGKRYHWQVMGKLDALEEEIEAAYQAAELLVSSATTAASSQQDGLSTVCKLKKRKSRSLYNSSDDEVECRDTQAVSQALGQSTANRTTTASSQQDNLPMVHTSPLSNVTFYKSTARKSRPSQDQSSLQMAFNRPKSP